MNQKLPVAGSACDAVTLIVHDRGV